MKNIVLSILLMSACAMIYAQADSSPYQAIVAVDGSGDYKTVQEAINAVPDGQTKPWLILIKNGLYNEQVIIPKNKPYVHYKAYSFPATHHHHHKNSLPRLLSSNLSHSAD